MQFFNQEKGAWETCFFFETTLSVVLHKIIVKVMMKTLFISSHSLTTTMATRKKSRQENPLSFYLSLLLSDRCYPDLFLSLETETMKDTLALKFPLVTSLYLNHDLKSLHPSRFVRQVRFILLFALKTVCIGLWRWRTRHSVSQSVMVCNKFDVCVPSFFLFPSVRVTVTLRRRGILSSSNRMKKNSFSQTSPVEENQVANQYISILKPTDRERRGRRWTRLTRL